MPENAWLLIAVRRPGYGQIHLARLDSDGIRTVCGTEAVLWEPTTRRARRLCSRCRREADLDARRQLLARLAAGMHRVVTPFGPDDEGFTCCWRRPESGGWQKTCGRGCRHWHHRYEHVIG